MPLYIVVDTSGSGFGLCWWVQDGVVVDAQFSRWSFDVTENELSKFWESANLINSLKSYLKSEKISRYQGFHLYLQRCCRVYLFQGIIKVTQTTWDDSRFVLTWDGWSAHCSLFVDFGQKNDLSRYRWSIEGWFVIQCHASGGFPWVSTL